MVISKRVHAVLVTVVMGLACFLVLTQLAPGTLQYASSALPSQGQASESEQSGAPTSNPESPKSEATPSTDRQVCPEVLPASDPIDWTQYAYTQYVTAPEHLCNAAMMFESLHRLESKAARSMLYPKAWDKEDNELNDADRKLLKDVRDVYNVDLDPIELVNGGGDPTWAQGFTKFRIFQQHQYKRVMMLDSDGTILQPLDELFLIPSSPVAIPRAYWLDEHPLSGQLLLVEPSEFEWKRVKQALKEHQSNEYDMEIIDKLYRHSAFTIPHRKYDLLSGEFRKEEQKHGYYLGSDGAIWDSDQIWNETKYVHFSDWPYPKPWIDASDTQKSEIAPKCWQRDGDKEDCRDREYWYRLYSDFSERRQRVCGRPFGK